MKNGKTRLLLERVMGKMISATAGFGYGILKAARLGYIDKKYVPQA